MDNKIIVNNSNKIYEHLRCPLTLQIFFEPVMATDSIVYEKEFIQEWYKNNNTSPLTNKIISDKSLYKSYIIQNIVNELIKLNPSIKYEQYCPINVEYCKILYGKNINKIKINKQIQSKYVVFNIALIRNLRNDNFTKYLIDNIDDIEYVYYKYNNYKLIHIIFKYSSPEMIKYIIDKGAIIDYNSKKILLYSQSSLKWWFLTVFLLNV